MASGSGWNVWVWLLGVVVRRYIDFLIIIIWVWLVGVVSRRWVWLVGVGGMYGCGY